MENNINFPHGVFHRLIMHVKLTGAGEFLTGLLEHKLWIIFQDAELLVDGGGEYLIEIVLPDWKFFR